MANHQPCGFIMVDPQPCFDPQSLLPKDRLYADPAAGKQHLRATKYHPPDISILCCQWVALSGGGVLECDLWFRRAVSRAKTWAEKGCDYDWVCSSLCHSYSLLLLLLNYYCLLHRTMTCSDNARCGWPRGRSGRGLRAHLAVCEHLSARALLIILCMETVAWDWVEGRSCFSSIKSKQPLLDISILRL